MVRTFSDQKQARHGGAPERLFLSVREVAALLGVCEATVYRLATDGELAHIRIRNAVRIAPAAVEEYLARAMNPDPAKV